MRKPGPLTPDLSSWRWVLGAWSSLVALLVVAHLFNRFVLGGDENFLRINAEGNPATWFSSVSFFLAAVMSFAYARVTPALRQPWTLLGLLMLGLSLDEVAAIHERIENAGDSRWSLLLLQPLIAVGAVALLVAVMRGLGREDRPLIGAAIVALISAQAVSTISSRLEIDGVVEAAIATVEEVLEFGVPTFVLACVVPKVWARFAAAGVET